MIPSDTNPFGLEYKNLTFHVIRNDKEIETVSTVNRKYKYAEFPQNLVSRYGKEWSLQPGKDYESYLKLKKYVSRGEQFGDKLIVTGNHDIWNRFELGFLVKFIAREIEYENQRTVPYGEKVGELPTVNRDGYSLIGWFDEESGQKVTPDKLIYKECEFPAHWSPIEYRITYDLKDYGKFLETPPYSYTIESQTINIPSPISTTDGYEFDRWEPTNVIEHGSFGDKDFVSYWKPEVYEIKYEMNGHGEEKAYGPTSYTIEDDDIIPSNPDNVEGWTFGYWSPEKIESGSTGDVTFNAHWNINVYTVRFWNENNLIDLQLVEYGSSAIAPENPTKTGYTFTGWDSDEYLNVKKDLDIHAQFQVIEYKIEYDMQGIGEVPETAPRTYTIEYDDVFPPDPDPVYGYAFLGWDPEYIPSGSTGGKKFVANWKNISIVVMFDSNEPKYTVRFLNEDDTVISEQSVIHGESAIEPEHPTKTGYAFTGWDKDFTNVKDNLDIRPAFQINTYTITTNVSPSGSGTVDGGGKYDYGSSATLKASPSTGYAFEEWSDDNTQNPRTIIVTRNKTYTAKFTQVTSLPFTSYSGSGTIKLGPGTYEVKIKGGNGGDATAGIVSDYGQPMGESYKTGGIGALAEFTITIDSIQSFQYQIGTNGQNKSQTTNYQYPASATSTSGSSTWFRGKLDGTDRTITSGGGGQANATYSYWSGAGGSNGSNGSVNWGGFTPGTSSNPSGNPYFQVNYA